MLWGKFIFISILDIWTAYPLTGFMLMKCFECFILYTRLHTTDNMILAVVNLISFM